MKLILLRIVYRIAIKVNFIHSLRAWFPLWSVSQLIYTGPAGPSATLFPEFLALKRVSAESKVSDSDLYRNLQHANANVAAYCLEALLLRRSNLLARLPLSLKSRDESVSMGFTGFVSYSPLSEYIARRISTVLKIDPEFY